MSENANDPQMHWLDMPEFEQRKVEPYACINMRFESREDLERFMELTGLRLTEKTKSAWFPEPPAKNTGMKRWT